MGKDATVPLQWAFLKNLGREGRRSTKSSPLPSFASVYLKCLNCVTAAWITDNCRLMIMIFLK